MNTRSHADGYDIADKDKEGVITLADRHFFAGFVLLYESIQRCYPVPVSCFDGGLSIEQKNWAARHLSNCTILPIPDNKNIRLIKEKLGGKSAQADREYKLWICPFLIEHSPYQRVIWLDSDTIVLANLRQLFKLLATGPILTPSNHAPQCVKNQSALYDEMPLGEKADDVQPLLNAGVSGWDCTRDQEVLKDYTLPAIKACTNEAIRQSITWHDQGSLIWAVQNNGLQHRIQKTAKWNFCAIHSDKADFNLRDDLNYQLKLAYPDANIIHWNHISLAGKLFSRLGSESDILNWARRSINQTHKNITDPAIISCPTINL